MIYEWDAEKARANWRKHSVSFDEATTVFEDTLGRIVSDPRHSIEEDRCVLLGLSRRNRLLAVMFTEQGKAVRIISARRATRQERRDYEEKTH